MKILKVSTGISLFLINLSTKVAWAQNADGSTDTEKGIGAIGGKVRVDKPPGFAFENVGELIKNAIGGLLIVAAILAFIYLILGGISWITSGGDKQAVEAARNKITNAIVGLIIVAAAYAIMLLAQSFLGLGTLFGT